MAGGENIKVIRACPGDTAWVDPPLSPKSQNVRKGNRAQARFQARETSVWSETEVKWGARVRGKPLAAQPWDAAGRGVLGACSVLGTREYSVIREMESNSLPKTRVVL